APIMRARTDAVYVTVPARKAAGSAICSSITSSAALVSGLPGVLVMASTRAPRACAACAAAIDRCVPPDIDKAMTRACLSRPGGGYAAISCARSGAYGTVVHRRKASSGASGAKYESPLPTAQDRFAALWIRGIHAVMPAERRSRG